MRPSPRPPFVAGPLPASRKLTSLARPARRGPGAVPEPAQVGFGRRRLDRVLPGDQGVSEEEGRRAASGTVERERRTGPQHDVAGPEYSSRVIRQAVTMTLMFSGRASRATSGCVESGAERRTRCELSSRSQPVRASDLSACELESLRCTRTTERCTAQRESAQGVPVPFVRREMRRERPPRALAMFAELRQDLRASAVDTERSRNCIAGRASESNPAQRCRKLARGPPAAAHHGRDARLDSGAERLCASRTSA